MRCGMVVTVGIAGLMKTLRVSPDGYIQQALQLAYARGNSGQV